MNILDLHRNAIRIAECHLELKEVDAEKRIIRGFASTPAIDKYADIVEPTAFKKTIGDYMKNGVVLMHHDAHMPMASPGGDFELGDKGLWIEKKIGQGIHALDHIEQGWNQVVQSLVRGLSIGFRIVKDESIDPNSDEGKRGARRRIKELRLFEISIVTIPAGEGTWFSIAKGLQYGSDAPDDLYHRNLWPDERMIRAYPAALEHYWSGRWPVRNDLAFRSDVARDVPDDESTTEGVDDGQSRDLAERIVSLRAKTAMSAAHRG